MSPSEPATPGQAKAVWQYLLSFYLGKRGYRPSLIAYGIGFWIFAIGALLVLVSGESPGIVMLILRNVFMHVGLFILVMMTYPVLRCAFDTMDMTRPKGRFRRIFEPVVVTLFAPLYLMLLVSSFMQYALAPTLLGN